jgi:hypothetical protein
MGRDWLSRPSPDLSPPGAGAERLRGQAVFMNRLLKKADFNAIAESIAP